MPVQSLDHKAPVLPPGFRAVPAARPWDAALQAAAQLSPGTLLHAPLGGMLEAALILAPERPVDDRIVLRFTTLAVREAIAGAVPPNSAVTIVADGAVAVNLGHVADIRLARGPSLGDGPLEDRVPAWLAVGFTVRVALGLAAPGLTAGLTDLAEEGAEVSAGAMLERVCRHLLAAIDLWQDQGAPGIDRAWRDASEMSPA